MLTRHHEVFADHGHELIVPIPVVVEIVEVEVPTVGVLIDVADDGVTVRVGLNHARLYVY